MFAPQTIGAACLEGTLREHISNVVDCFRELRTTPFTGNGDAYYRLNCRCAANLDALRVAGEEAIGICNSETKADGEMASVFALLLAECCENKHVAGSNLSFLLRDEALKIRHSAWLGLRLAEVRRIEPHLRDLVKGSLRDFRSAAALDILAFHRLPVRAVIGLPPEDEDIAWLLAEAGGRIPGAWNAELLRQYLAHPAPRVREAALRAAARSRVSALPVICREAAARAEGSGAEAISFLGVVGAADDVNLLRSAAKEPEVAKSAVEALGRLGLVAGVPTLLDLLANEELGEPAAFAFWRITGEKPPRGPAAAPPPGLSENELDLWEPKAPVDVSAARAWWRTNSRRFDPQKTWQVGLCVSDDPLGAVFDQLPLAVRYDVYLRQRALKPNVPDWELETWGWKQKNP